MYVCHKNIAKKHASLFILYPACILGLSTDCNTVIKPPTAVSVRAERAHKDRESPQIQWQEVSWGYIFNHGGPRLETFSQKLQQLNTSVR